jgi:hypothetical protein
MRPPVTWPEYQTAKPADTLGRLAFAGYGVQLAVWMLASTLGGSDGLNDGTPLAFVVYAGVLAGVVTCVVSGLVALVRLVRSRPRPLHSAAVLLAAVFGATWLPMATLWETFRPE